MLGYSIAYNTLDNNRNPTSGLLAEFKQDFAGVGGDVNFIRSTAEARTYYEVFSDVVTVLRLQGGHITGWGGKELRMLDHFQMGPNLVRGFAPAGLGPRDMTLRHEPGCARRHACTGARARGAAAVRSCRRMSASRARCSRTPARSGTTKARPSGTHRRNDSCRSTTRRRYRASVGVGLIWNSPFGPLRFDYSFPLTKGLRPDPAVPLRRRHQILVDCARIAGSQPLRPAPPRTRVSGPKSRAPC